MVSRVLLILGLLLVLAPSAGGANQHERRTATLLYGVPSDGFQSCFAPFLHRQVEYQLNANAAWGFGTMPPSTRQQMFLPLSGFLHSWALQAARKRYFGFIRSK